MITTRDGLVRKRGESVFELGFHQTLKKYMPLKSRVHIDLNNETTAWSTKELCQAECSKRNQKNGK